jgi:hypothetical protein
VRVSAFAVRNSCTTYSRSQYRRTTCNRLIRALLRGTKILSKRAPSASLPGSFANVFVALQLSLQCGDDGAAIGASFAAASTSLRQTI